MSRFFDLIQTPSVMVPVFFAVTVLAVFAMTAYYLIRRPDPDANDLSMARDYDQQMRVQESKLAYLAEHGDLPPEGMRVDTLNRGANVSRKLEATTRVVNTPYSDLAAKYGFETHKHHQRGELILFDTRFELLDASKRMVVFPVSQLVQADAKSLKRLIARHRHYINRKAQRAGLLAVRPRPGNPGNAAA